VDSFPDAFPDIAVTRVEPMGGYAVHIAFTDGHARGIFPWAYLRALAAEAVVSAPAAAQAA
jgi:prepilin-type processing-associated H-X9-DG protein